MKITIAGHGSIGHYIEGVFQNLHDIDIYDPALGHANAATLRDTDFVIVCVPTPTAEDGSCDTSIVEEIICKSDPRTAIICTSTVAIGTTDRLISTYRKDIVFAPEYAGETDEHPLRNPKNRNFLFFGGYGRSLDAVSALFEESYRDLGATPTVKKTSPKNAEIVKYMENSFLATKVGFVNEFYDLCSYLEADFEEVRSLWLLDERVDVSHTIVTPERGFGGKCLPKDTNAVVASARSVGMQMEIMEAVISANKTHRMKGIS